jgi:hypothetical protein
LQRGDPGIKNCGAQLFPEEILRLLPGCQHLRIDIHKLYTVCIKRWITKYTKSPLLSRGSSLGSVISPEAKRHGSAPDTRQLL